jgi:hypothetical protein
MCLEPITRAGVGVVLVAMAITMATAGMQDGPDPGATAGAKGHRLTEDPGPISGTMYRNGAEVRGTFCSSVIEIGPVSVQPEVDAVGAPCTSWEESVCWQGCENQITDPYCTQMGTWCEENWSTGGVSCHCGYFCAKDIGGIQHKPHRLGIVETSF